jgi:molybdopterin converting factor small subunit
MLPFNFADKALLSDTHQGVAAPPQSVSIDQPLLMPTVTVLFFASAREAAGNVSSTELDVPESAAATESIYSRPFDTAQLRRLLAQQYPGLAAFLQDETSVTMAVNEEYVPPGQVVTLKPGDTVALIPPISGG